MPGILLRSIVVLNVASPKIIDWKVACGFNYSMYLWEMGELINAWELLPRISPKVDPGPILNLLEIVLLHQVFLKVGNIPY